MKIKMELLSDTIFGNGVSIPGAEDIAVQCDTFGFPFYKGGTFKGLFREEYENYLYVCGKTEVEIRSELRTLFGESGENESDPRRLVFSDFSLSEGVKKAVLDEIEGDDYMRVTEIFTHIRTFTKINEDGMIEDGTLRRARCIDRGLCFYSELRCSDEDACSIREALSFVKSIGTMRNRGFGRVKLSDVTEGQS